ncbi:MAG: C4-dicarboxylate ABC transporter substrate-binding protein [Oceanospirillaceae bacterium]|jgi:TRAP-type C4-dicarboxylate transport system substrate-binding protein|uniref:TRAP transporter substrate-binding protein n=1 Tax=Marinobacterium litorale TaxID=404770 RepID=UPI00040B7611|nr:TRAP transporter substrate-binding protein [Marinobacterium litorale]MBS99921.1 C4-dicarboxylate ABC transporter substrate-binding protein [Oceanospirillaceae bacterium]
MKTILGKVSRRLATGAVALTLSAGMAANAVAAEYNWRFANLYSRGTAFGEVYQSMADNIETMSGGRISVKMMYAGEGVSTNGIFGAVKTGLITMGAPFQPMHAGEMAEGIIEVGLPGGTDNPAELMDLFYEKGFGEILDEAYAAHGIKYLDPYIQPPVYILTKEPINSVEDFEGLKIRAPGAYGKFLRNLGASPVNLTWSEIYTSLSTGVIDGSIGSNLIDHRDGNHVEVAKYMYRLPLAGAQVLPVIVNQKAWDQLPEDLQAIVKAATTVHARDQLTKSRAWESQAVADMEAKGLKWSPEPSDADRKAWKAAGANLWEEYAKESDYSARLIEVLKQDAAQ